MSVASRRLASVAALSVLPLVVLGVFFVLPVSGMLARGWWPDGTFDPGGVLSVLGRARVHRVLWFTLWSATVACAISVLVGVPAAYVGYRLRFPGRDAVRAALLVPFVLPTVVVGVAFRQLLAEGGPLGFLGLDGSPVAILAGLVFFNASVVVRTVGTAWADLDPRPGEAAAALGASPAQVWWTVTLPALRPAIVSAASVVFLFCATAFGIVLILGGLRYATVETEIYLLTTNLLDLRGAAALSLVQLLVVVILLATARRLRAVPDAAVSRTRPTPRHPTRSDLPALVVTGTLLMLIAAPLATLVAGSLDEGPGWGFGNYARLASPSDGLAVAGTDALVNSLQTAVDATWMALLLGVPVAVIATGRARSVAEGRVRGLVDGLFMLPLGVSAVTVGFGFLITLGQPPLSLRDHPLLVPIAQALVALPLVVRTLTPVLGAVDDRQRQAAASLGASPWRVWLTVDGPLLWRPMLAAAGFAFSVSLGEFGATSFLAREDAPTLPVLIFRLLGHPGAHNYGTALAASVLLAGAAAVAMLAVERLRIPTLGVL